MTRIAVWFRRHSAVRLRLGAYLFLLFVAGWLAKLSAGGSNRDMFHSKPIRHILLRRVAQSLTPGALRLSNAVNTSDSCHRHERSSAGILQSDTMCG